MLSSACLVASWNRPLMVIFAQAPYGKPLPYMLCGDPESGTDHGHSLKKVSACLIWHRVDIQGSCHKDVYTIFDLFLEVISLYSQLMNMYVQKIQMLKVLILFL